MHPNTGPAATALQQLSSEMNKSSPKLFGKSMSLPPCRRMHSPTTCQLFTHESNIFLCEKYSFCTFKPIMGANAEKSPKQPLPFGAREPHPIHECMGWPHSPCQTTALLVHTALQNYATKSLGRPNSPKLPLPFDDDHPHLIHPPSTDPTLHPKQHPDPISRFAIVHFADRQTDRRSRQMFRNRQRRANNK